MEFMRDWNLALQVTFILAIVLGCALIVTLAFAFFKPRLNRKQISFLYAFSSGFILVLSIKGLIGSAYDSLGNYFTDSTISDTFITMLIIGSGVIAACVMYFALHHFLVLKGEVHNKHEKHAHPEAAVNIHEMDNPKRKWIVIIFVIMHRIPAGINLGILIYELNHGQTIALGVLIAFILHVIPESLVIFYRHMQIKNSVAIALRNSILIKMTLIPMMFVGAYLSEALHDVYWVLPWILSFGGAAMAFAAVLELAPELFHVNSTDNKSWYKIVLTLMIGFVLAILILVIDKH